MLFEGITQWRTTLHAEHIHITALQRHSTLCNTLLDDCNTDALIQNFLIETPKETADLEESIRLLYRRALGQGKGVE